MNVTIKIHDQLCRDARHRAVDEGLSLSGWIASVVHKELQRLPSKKRPTLLEALGNEKLSHFEIDFPRDESSLRKTDFT
jgi:hypothetical protein